MTLGELRQGERFVLCRSGAKYIKLSGVIKSRHIVLDVTKNKTATLNHQCRVKRVLRAKA